MTYPIAPLGVRIRVAIGPIDYSADPSTYPWVDFTSRVLHTEEIKDVIGASDDVSDTNSSLEFTFKNDDGEVTTDNPESSLYPYFDIGTPIEYALDVGDGGGWRIQTITYLTSAELGWPSGTQYRCLVAVTSSGQLQRLGLQPLTASALYRTMLSAQRKGFWPLEDENGSTLAASALPAVPPMRPGTAGPAFGETSLVPGAMRMVKFAAGERLVGDFAGPTTRAGLRLSALLYLGTNPATQQELFDIRPVGDGNRYVVEIGPSTLRFRAYNNLGAEISSASAVAFTAHLSGAVWFEMDVLQTGTNTITWTLRETSWRINTDGQAVGSTLSSSAAFAGKWTQSIGVSIAPTEVVGDATIGMLAATESPFPSFGGFAAVLGWAGNTATARVQGMCNEFKVPSSVTSTSLGSPMGPQLIDSLEANLRDVAQTDHGVLTDHLGVIGYRALSELYNLTPAFTLARTVRGQLGELSPVRDDTAKVNRASVTRPNGSTATVEDSLDIALNGLYERGAETINVATDAVLPAHAGWYLARGISKSQRYDSLTMKMRTAAEYTPALAGQVATLKLGDRIAVSSLPPQAAKGGIERQVRGREQTVLNRGMGLWNVSYKLVPTDPYQAFQFDLTRLDTSGTEMILAASSAATTLMASTAGALPTVGAGLSIPLDAGGERVTLTAVAAEVITDAFTRTVSNGWGSVPATTHLPAYAWTSATPTALAVGGSSATQTVAAANSSVSAHLAGLLQLDTDCTAYCSYGVVPTGANLEIQMNYRHNAVSGLGYAVRIVLETAGTVRLQLYAPGGSTPLADLLTPLIHASGIYYGIRVAPIGRRHRVRVWQGITEPTGWHVDLLDDTVVTPGYVVLRAGRASLNTNSPAIATWDDFTINNSQAFTVTRSVNGVVKAQPLNGRIRLWQTRGLAV